MNRKTWMTLAACMLTATFVSAQDAPPTEQNDGNRRGPRRERGAWGGRGGERGGERRGGRGMGMGMMRDMRGEAEKQLAEKYKDEYAVLCKERQENEAKFQALAKKAEVKLPEADFTRREKYAAFEKKYEKELKEINELAKKDFRAAMQKRMELMKKEGFEMPSFGGGPRGPGMGMGPGGDRGPRDGAPEARRGNPRQQMEKAMKEKFPADYAEYEKLKQSDPSAARDKLRVMAQKLRDSEKGGNPPPAK